MKKEEKLWTYSRLSEDDLEDLFRMNAEGRSCGEIAEYIGCSATAIQIRLRKIGIHGRRAGVWSQADDNTLIMLWNGTTKLKDIANVLHRSKDSVSMRVTILRKRGYNVRYRRI